MFAVSNVILAIIPWLIGQFAGSLTGSDSSLYFWTGLLIAASIGHDLTWRAAEFLYLKLLLPRSHRIDDHIFSAVQQHEYGFFVDKFTGKISSYTNSLGREFRELLDAFCYQYVYSIVALPILIWTMFTVNRYTGIVFAGSLVLMFMAGRVLARHVAAAEKKEADERSTIEGFAVDAIANFVSVKAFGNGRLEARRLFDDRIKLIQAADHSFFKSIIFWAVMSIFVRWIIWPATFVLNIHLYQQGAITLGQMGTFLAAIVLFSTFIWEIIWNVSQLNIKVARVEEAYRYLFGTRNIMTDPPAPEVPGLQSAHFQNTLEIRNLQFAYPDKPDVPVIKDLHLCIKQGEKIGVVGPSGGGKSTILKLLLGYYPIDKQAILLDDSPTDNQQLKGIISYVPQDTSVFHRSIRDNIAYGKPEATDKEVQEAARHAQAHEFILALDKGYDTLVGERGVKLSGGQRQRIAIARAVLKDAPILLLDEATSALDSESEQLIQAAFDDLFTGRTAIVIAHRLSTIQKLDRIIVVDAGRIVEQGTHAELIAAGGLYAKLWQHQSGGFIEE